MRIGKPSPALVVSIIALVFAMTGTGIAAKSLITGKQIKDGSITAKDIANGAITDKKVRNGAITQKKLGKGAVATSNIAPNAVTSGALAPKAVTDQALAAGAVTGSALAPDAVTEANVKPGTLGLRSFTLTICPNGIVVPRGSNCPVLNVSFAKTQNVELNALIPLFNMYTVSYGAQPGTPIVNPIVRFARDPGIDTNNVFDNADPTSFRLDADGRRCVKVHAAATFSGGGDLYDIVATVRHADGSIDQIPGGTTFAPPSGGTSTVLTLDTTVRIDSSAGDWVQFAVGSRNAPATLDYMEAKITPNDAAC